MKECQVRAFLWEGGDLNREVFIWFRKRIHLISIDSAQQTHAHRPAPSARAGPRFHALPPGPAGGSPADRDLGRRSYCCPDFSLLGERCAVVSVGRVRAAKPLRRTGGQGRDLRPL